MYEFRFDPSQPRDDHGRWTTTGGSALTPSPGGVVGETEAAAAAAAKVIGGEAVTVTATAVDDVVGEFAAAPGPVDLTLVTVESLPGLFSAMRGNGVPRAEMPQIPSERLDEFQDRLRDSGIDFQLDRADPATLKATQSELDGRKVGGMMLNMRSGEFSLEGDPLWVSSDGHILDGHHRWAAAAALSADCGGCIEIPIVKVDVAMSDLLSFANRFNDDVGVRRKAFGEPDELVAAAGNVYYAMATDAADGVVDADLAGLAHGDGSAFAAAPRQFRAATFAFDPSQPRDERGRWSTSGAWSPSGYDSGVPGDTADGLTNAEIDAIRSGAEPGERISATAESDALAAPLATKAREVEPQITGRLTEINEMFGGEFYGLEFRLKAENKISEKIERVVVEDGVSRDAAAAAIKDAVRYTIHFDEDGFGDSAQAAVDGLRADGNRVIVKNTWPPEAGKSYKGVNVNVYRPDGVVYEVQFHTPQSQQVKDEMHRLYEAQRVLPPTSPRWDVLERQMLAMGNRQPVPRNATKVFRVARTRHAPRRVFGVSRSATLSAEVR